jgi:large subunit ribosomal protein L7/L12
MAKGEEEKERKATKTTKGDGKLEKIIKSIEELTVLELADLVKALQEKFGVSAIPQAAAVVATQDQGPTTEGPTEPVEEQTTFNVILANSGANKISVIKALREINPQLGLKDAKDIADAPPKEILTGVNKEQAEEAKQKLTAAGAQVELK